ncbi:major facilitator superfamily permease [Liquorilactobacillus aquaticus DSM 21051]|uniref:Major facilitator superfamily permease n=1 Tax=Liquorilactobacillus aquaticus DSM 21051 TaxID=1423725 RepID=A0A0R2CYK2_9LACO|nr:MFS transporter [Liquorilactobacillus aquaticus]KRM97087.1 major facilitator superfamily permease [Liquorilactobacillus aquaticus DSM 21051]
MNKIKKGYFPLILSPFASQLGSAIYVLGLNWLIVRSTGNTKTLGLIEGLGGLAFLLGDFLVGLLVDQYNRKKVLIWTDIVSALMCFVGSFYVNNEKPQVWLLIAITSILNLMLSLNYPAAKALAPEVVAKTHLQKFNAISNTFFNLANIGAPLIGGALLAIKGIDFMEFLLINALSYIVALMMNLLIPYKNKSDVKGDKKESALASTLTGFKYVKKHPRLLMYMLAMGIFNFCYAGFLLAAPYVAQHFFEGRSTNYSLFLTFSAAGGILGGLWLTFQKREISPQRIYQEQLFCGFVLIICGSFLSLSTWILIALVYGIFQTRFFGSITTFIQGETDTAFLGRIFGLTFLFFDGIQPVGDFIFGFFVSSWNQWTYVILGGCLVTSFSLLQHFRKDDTLS